MKSDFPGVLAATLVTAGVITYDQFSGIVSGIIGAALITFGIRLAIDLGRAGKK